MAGPDSLRGVQRVRGICEVLRMIGDRAQGDTTNDKEIRDLVAEAETYAGRMSLKLREYNTKYDEGWYAKNDRYIQEHGSEFRRAKGYKIGQFDASLPPTVW